MKRIYDFTHWACFDCRKSFAKEESPTPRKCPECAAPMTDMGAYFEPPRKLNKKRWTIMKTLADYGYKFQSKGSKSYIDGLILQVKNPRLVDVVERIEELKRKATEANKDE